MTELFHCEGCGIIVEGNPPYCEQCTEHYTNVEPEIEMFTDHDLRIMQLENEKRESEKLIQEQAAEIERLKERLARAGMFPPDEFSDIYET